MMKVSIESGLPLSSSPPPGEGDTEGEPFPILYLYLYLCLCLCLSVLASCAAHPRLMLTDPIGAQRIDAILARHPLAAGENIKAVPLQTGAHASVTLVQIRDREQPHRHTRYDITVTLVRGTGTLHLGTQVLPMAAGDAAFITKGTPHYFVNDGDAPAVALVTFAPAFSGPDQEPLYREGETRSSRE